ncbi:hypothetical protein KO500_07665 [Cellulophaga baltica]|uniref:hypothetical protein n=1 Tax=Cellulophaga TaxID=104264 RepID=UPI001C072A6F|nr:MULTISPECIES: hypothetical protein [Cellulophaga]MBU2996307.1 hypothetical protein [Cellulophaga baltica]MDO6767702.1 hypothetical protein [Cellulophaga sp. 1_MG-2023]
MKIPVVNIRFSVFITSILCFININAQEINLPIQDNITYSSFTDSDNIYVQLSTIDQPTMLSMLHRGFNVYFDVKGKKKKKISVQYPSEVTLPQRPERRNEDSNFNSVKSEGAENEMQDPEIAELILRMPKMANYNHDNYEEEFHLDLNNLGITITYSFDEQTNTLLYKLIMPLKNISLNTKTLSKLSIGIVTTEMDDDNDSIDSNSNFSIGGGGQDGGSGGGQGGGPGGGGGLGRQSGGGQGGVRPDHDDKPEDISIDFWFKANLME